MWKFDNFHSWPAMDTFKVTKLTKVLYICVSFGCLHMNHLISHCAKVQNNNRAISANTVTIIRHRENEVLYMSFDKFLLAVKSSDLSQAIIRVFSFPNLFLNDKIYRYTKKLIWHMAIWQNWCFGWFYHSKIGKIEK